MCRLVSLRHRRALPFPWVYPRVCGGTTRSWNLATAEGGLSPRVQGNRDVPEPRLANGGSIPACAGEPDRQAAGCRSRRVYPRVCGGTSRLARTGEPPTGLSPRVRGNREHHRTHRRSHGSIPACAGEPWVAPQAVAPGRVYPRVCGGTATLRRRRPTLPGLSPRVRGNLPGACVVPKVAGSIPACAGEPRPPASGCRRAGVYPRVCGGTRATDAFSDTHSGLSPRVRGNLRLATREATALGSIPACAGEPPSGSRSASAAGVYPRVCGGTSFARLGGILEPGLSPRVRGNRGAVAQAREIDGSIPACAGEPSTFRMASSLGRVYPRVCGGTSAAVMSGSPDRGLSPRVRGNPSAPVLTLSSFGSIPACAGEPRTANLPSMLSRVYPRVCGGTEFSVLADNYALGLSPRVRGNHRRRHLAVVPRGSIPACAGEPRCPRWTRRWRWVYPRVCGGTLLPVAPALAVEGLSPRVRGNQLRHRQPRLRGGSIPACAGEPCWGAATPPACRVYPRVCGGTAAAQTQWRWSEGLSPRVRGNPGG